MAGSHAPLVIHTDRLSIPAGSVLRKLPWVALAVGVLSSIAAFVLRSGEHPDHFYFSWLVAFLFFLSIALGGLFFVLTHYATKSGWGVVLRRFGENAAAALPVFILLFIPIAMGIHDLFHWSHEDAVAHDALLQGKAPWLNSQAFLIRAGVYLVLWSGIAWWFRSRSLQQDRSRDEGITRALIGVSGPGLIVFALTVTFAAFDWIMSLDPHWYSTIFGVYYFAGCIVGFHAFLILASARVSGVGQMRDVVTTEHFHDMGKYLFAFTVFWSYIAFSQFFLIWYGNIPEETAWYLHRMEGNWSTITAFLALGHFVVPFFFLMPRTIKRNTPLLAIGAVWMLFMHLVDMYWLVMPTLQHHGAHFALVDLACFVGVGGIFLGTVGLATRGHALVPIGDPRLAESIAFENF